MSSSEAESSIVSGLQQQQPALEQSPSPVARTPSGSPTHGTVSQSPSSSEIIATSEDTFSEHDFTDMDLVDDMEIDNYENEHLPLKRSENVMDVGEEINLAFVDPMESEDDDEAHDIFDDGVADDFSDSVSEVSTNFEELPEPDTATRVVHIVSRVRHNMNDDGGFKGDENSTSASKEEDAEEELTPEEGTEQASNGTQDGGAQEAGSVDIRPKSFAKLEEHHYQLFYLKDTRGDHHSLQQYTDNRRWHLLELEEIKRDLEGQISTTKQAIELAENNQQEAEDTFSASLENSGLSQELYDSYMAFCESLDPEFGQRGGFSITCHADHAGSYIKYDPEFAILKDCIEMPFDHCNFRCEASILTTSALVAGTEYVVEFWPLKAPEPFTGSEQTWGEQYPELYELAITAIRAGSEAAMELLIALPDMNSGFRGGWLFEYQFEKALSKHPIVGKRWRFRSAHKIDKPCTVEEKRKRLNLMFAPENIR